MKGRDNVWMFGGRSFCKVYPSNPLKQCEGVHEHRHKASMNLLCARVVRPEQVRREIGGSPDDEET